MSKKCLDAREEVSAVAFEMPAGACDAHAHVFGPYDAYPLTEDRSYTPREYLPRDFMRHLEQIGAERGVLVTGSASGLDNGSILNALSEYPDQLRGVIIPSADFTDAQLDDWTEMGVRGVRANLYQVDGRKVYRSGAGLEAVEALAPRLAERGWHLQVWIHAPDLAGLMPRLESLKLPLVIDHMGRMSTSRGVDDAGFQRLCGLLAEGRLWTKISGADRNTREGPPYSDVDPYAQAILRANSEQVVWGTDWPHINYYDAAHMPDDGVLANLLARWMPDPAMRKRVLIDNPARLYGFPAGAAAGTCPEVP
ncbi:amidohydrolase family protein [Pollutimonas bauzanensis]|uniref:Predicted metal-dependent hydrolase, TIM-barrel fold n=1 Tax=Pollutimonas bauzanensis TaxID=658167 RepID=A0A1M5X5S9_9BURK|nr:amidohydrolase family protein [Pollutimonas bauzanensis]SHH94918.1 Predicted metal-dependent hydrolase, TIM-barrel fold [Pollutimonas bauzanensis]